MASVIIGDYEYTGYYGTVPSRRYAKAKVVDKTKSSYGQIQSQVTIGGTTYPVTDLTECFLGCNALTSAPTIPNGVTNLYRCFTACEALTTAPEIPSSVNVLTECFLGCNALTSAPTIPNGVTSMRDCFRDCEALTTAPEIPSSVNVLTRCFYGCDALTGEIIINAGNVTGSDIDGMFYSTEKAIWLTGTSPKLAEMAATATNNNVFVGEIPLNYSLDIERVVGDGGTTPDPEGLYAHIQLTINWTDCIENSIDAITLKNGMATVSPTWYTDAAKSSTISLPNWKPSANVTIHCWVEITSATHVFSVTVADRYHTGAVISFTVPQQFRTMDFLAGGQGIAFGMPATQVGFYCNMNTRFLNDLKKYNGTRDIDLDISETTIQAYIDLGMSLS